MEFLISSRLLEVEKFVSIKCLLSLLSVMRCCFLLHNDIGKSYLQIGCAKLKIHAVVISNFELLLFVRLEHAMNSAWYGFWKNVYYLYELCVFFIVVMHNFEIAINTVFSFHIRVN